MTVSPYKPSVLSKKLDMVFGSDRTVVPEIPLHRRNNLDERSDF